MHGSASTEIDLAYTGYGLMDKLMTKFSGQTTSHELMKVVLTSFTTANSNGRLFLHCSKYFKVFFVCCCFFVLFFTYKQINDVYLITLFFFI